MAQRIIDDKVIAQVIRHFKERDFTTSEFATRFRDDFPDDWKALEAKYGPGGAHCGSYYSANTYLSQQLRSRADRGHLELVGWKQAPPMWGNRIVASWRVT